MKITSAQYSHTPIGFPGAVLKWHYDGRQHLAPYWTLKGIIQPWEWTHLTAIYTDDDCRGECKRFADYIRMRFSEDASVQG